MVVAKVLVVDIVFMSTSDFLDVSVILLAITDVPFVSISALSVSYGSIQQNLINMNGFDYILESGKKSSLFSNSVKSIQQLHYS